MATYQVEALIAAMPERYRALVVLAAGTGLRHGEALGLELDAIDFLRRTPAGASAAGHHARPAAVSRPAQDAGFAPDHP